MKKSRLTPKLQILYLLLGFFCLNILVLDYLVIKSLLPALSNVLGQSDSATCPQSCLSYIDRRTGTSVPSAKEYYVPLGAGSVSSRDWADVTGAESTIDSTGYGRIKSVVFEATIAVPTGNQTVWVRLYNATDKHPVWYSELAMSGSGPTILTSPAITLDRGTKTYVVQIKSQLGSPANLIQSRLKITTK